MLMNYAFLSLNQEDSSLQSSVSAWGFFEPDCRDNCGCVGAEVVSGSGATKQ